MFLKEYIFFSFLKIYFFSQARAWHLLEEKKSLQGFWSPLLPEVHFIVLCWFWNHINISWMPIIIRAFDSDLILKLKDEHEYIDFIFMFHKIISFQHQNRLYFPQPHVIFLVFLIDIFDIRVTIWLEFMTQIVELLWNMFKPVSTLFQFE